jgi:limonene-1,2-epoxide hydrolase
MKPTDIAESFSQHEFTSIYGHLAADVSWNNVGGECHVGHRAVIAACDAAEAYFARIDSSVELRRTVTDGDLVIVEAVGVYLEDGHTSRVASCDLYEFRDEHLAVVTSYNVELAT